MSAARPGIEQRVTRIALALLLLAAAMRLAPYVHDRPLSFDEARLALNVIERTPARLLEPLDHEQGAPAGFLLLAKAAQRLGGNSERVLRAVPLAASLAALLLFFVLARRCCDGPTWLLALGLLAPSISLIYYGCDFKQYSGDVAWGLALSLSTLLALERRDRASLLALGGLGAVAQLMSHPSVFVLAGAGTALLVEERRAGHGRMAWLVGVGAFWVLVFAVHYLLLLRPLSHDPLLRAYWGPDFMPWPPSGASARWLGLSLVELGNAMGAGASMTAWLHSVAGVALALVTLVPVGLGVALLWRERRPICLLLGVPCLLALAAAVARVYPFHNRLILFLAPALILFCAIGLVDAGRRIGRTGPLIVALMLLHITGIPAARALLALVHPIPEVRVDLILDAVEQRARPGDSLYVFSGALPTVAYYHRHSGRYPLRGVRIHFGQVRGEDRRLYEEELRTVGKVPRLWVVVAHSLDFRTGRDSLPTLGAALDGLGKRLEAVRARDAAGFLYDLR